MYVMCLTAGTVMLKFEKHLIVCVWQCTNDTVISKNLLGKMNVEILNWYKDRLCLIWD